MIQCSWKGNDIPERVKWGEGCNWKLSPKIESVFTHPIGVDLVPWNTYSWCVQCFRFPRFFVNIIRSLLLLISVIDSKFLGNLGPQGDSTWELEPTAWTTTPHWRMLVDRPRFPGSNGCQGSGAESHWTTEQGDADSFQHDMMHFSSSKEFEVIQPFLSTNISDIDTTSLFFLWWNCQFL